MIDTTLSSEDFAYVVDLVRRQCALHLEPGKEYLIQSRLAPLAERRGFASIAQYFESLRRGSTPVVEVVEAMVTHETSFFRDIHPFETLKRSVLPALIAFRRPDRRLRIWCAACSSGQEPYSLALLLREYFPELNDWQIQISATDISEPVLHRARQGVYSQFEVNRGLPIALLLKWFRQEGAEWRLDDRVRQMVTFSAMNLAAPWPAVPPWDLIFLRNVLIYFDVDLKKQILARAAELLRPHSYLVLGGAETTLNLNQTLVRNESLRSGFYQLKTADAVIA